MRIAIVSDIHGNLTAFEAVLADLRETAPDLILHGGDLAHGGARPAEIVDRIRDLGWPGVMGNVDEMLPLPQTFEAFAGRSLNLKALWDAVREMAAATRALLGEERIGWLGTLPRRQILPPLALVHASPESTWSAPGPEAGDAQLESVYSPLSQPIVAYGHIHRAYIRSLAGMTIANGGSTGMPYDGDRRASYLLLDDSVPSIRRVEYDLDRELKAVADSGIPHSQWIAKMLETAAPQMP